MSASSLLSHLEAPVLVGDPDGCVAYANAAFLERFSAGDEKLAGRPLADIFSGGVREGVLAAVAEVCGRGRSARFRARHEGRGYAGYASPIVAEKARVGFLLIFMETSAQEERLPALIRVLADSFDELGRVLEELAIVSPPPERRALAERGLTVLARARKALEAPPAARKPSSG